MTTTTTPPPDIDRAHRLATERARTEDDATRLPCGCLEIEVNDRATVIPCFGHAAQGERVAA